MLAISAVKNILDLAPAKETEVFIDYDGVKYEIGALHMDADGNINLVALTEDEEGDDAEFDDDEDDDED